MKTAPGMRHAGMQASGTQILTPTRQNAQTGVRVSKLMAERGLCSRREADSYIERGWVLLDGKPVTELGTKALPSQQITSVFELRTVFMVRPYEGLAARSRVPRYSSRPGRRRARVRAAARPARSVASTFAHAR